jgi:hypothetical protein
MGFQLELTAFFGCDKGFREVEWGSMGRVKKSDRVTRQGFHDGRSQSACRIESSRATS